MGNDHILSLRTWGALVQRGAPALGRRMYVPGVRRAFRVGEGRLSLQTVHTALRNECWGGCNVEQSAMQLAHGGSVSQPMADTDTHRLCAALREAA